MVKLLTRFECDYVKKNVHQFSHPLTLGVTVFKDSVLVASPSFSSYKTTHGAVIINALCNRQVMTGMTACSEENVPKCFERYVHIFESTRRKQTTTKVSATVKWNEDQGHTNEISLKSGDKSPSCNGHCWNPGLSLPLPAVCILQTSKTYALTISISITKGYSGRLPGNIFQCGNNKQWSGEIAHKVFYIFCTLHT